MDDLGFFVVPPIFGKNGDIVEQTKEVFLEYLALSKKILNFKLEQEQI